MPVHGTIERPCGFECDANTHAHLLECATEFVAVRRVHIRNVAARQRRCIGRRCSPRPIQRLGRARGVWRGGGACARAQCREAGLERAPQRLDLLVNVYAHEEEEHAHREDLRACVSVLPRAISVLTLQSSDRRGPLVPVMNRDDSS